jgi:cytochrome c
MVRQTLTALTVAATLSLLGAPGAPAQTNPCAAKNPCAAEGKVDRQLVTRPAGTKLAAGPPADLLKHGEQLWNDKKLSTNGMACQTCHVGNASFKASFAKPYPHPVAMVSEKAGMKQVRLDEMVQLCLVVPMAAKPLPWDSPELAALTAYTADVQKRFMASGVRPATAANPCAAKNPCATRK